MDAEPSPDAEMPVSDETAPSEIEADGSVDAAETNVPTREPVNPWVAILGVLTLLTLLGIVFVEPAIEILNARPSSSRARLVATEPALLIQQRAMQAITALWFFTLGASFGSFLHCVEYRLPRRISVVARGSSCPGCGTAIKAWHNVPVFGWLCLRGRCAACGWPIPHRYALTELLFGVAFVVLMAVELVGGGMNLPYYLSDRMGGSVDNIWDPNWKLIGIFVFHATLITLLMTWSLFAIDRWRVASPLVALGFAVGIVGPFVFPMLQRVAWNGGPLPARGAVVQVVVGHLIATLAGLMLGGVLTRRARGNVRSSDAASTILAMVLVSVFLGWQAGLAIAVGSTLLRLVLLFTPGRRWPVIVSITIATLVQLLCWRWLVQQPWYPGSGAWFITAIEVGLVIVAAMWIDSAEQGGDAGPNIVLPTVKSDPVLIVDEPPAAPVVGVTSGEPNEEPSEDSAQ